LFYLHEHLVIVRNLINVSWHICESLQLKNCSRRRYIFGNYHY